MRRDSFYLRWVRRPLWVVFGISTGVFLFSLVVHVGRAIAFGPAPPGPAGTGLYNRVQEFYWVMCVSCLLLIVLPGPPRDPEPGTCQSCGYNLTGNVSGVCPECGERI